ncbi:MULTISPECIES: hypothetical protein [unclassified Methanobrevibacter]|jgi:hypothetical protein|uniref:hypothetical protein n=1 Tax=unclassified Methanobrevibacter TaxID=2638681 RepID=UPI00376195A2|nr:hypothetical protein [Methanobacteriaceae archaeon]
MKSKILILLVFIAAIGLLIISPASAQDVSIAKSPDNGAIMGSCQCNDHCLNSGQFLDINCSNQNGADINTTKTYCNTVYNYPQDYPMDHYIPYNYQQNQKID